jgi:hypothetical protein
MDVGTNAQTLLYTCPLKYFLCCLHLLTYLFWFIIYYDNPLHFVVSPAYGPQLASELGFCQHKKYSLLSFLNLMHNLILYRQICFYDLITDL